MIAITITADEASQRFDKFLAKYLREADKGFIYKMLRKKNITLNGAKAAGSEILAEGDEVKIFFSDETLEKFRGAPRKAAPAGRKVTPQIIYEDCDVLIVSKPAGMLSQRSAARDHSLNDVIIEYLTESGFLTQERSRAFMPSICNRLDRNTSGLVTAGKTLRGLQGLSGLFRTRDLGKYYLAVVCGEFAASARLEGYVDKDASGTVHYHKDPAEGRDHIVTEVEPLDVQSGFSLLRVHLITGRTHQIRVSMKELGHPIVGDPRYGDNDINRQLRTKYQLLHAHTLTFGSSPDLPQLEGRTFTAPLPAYFARTLRELGLSSKGLE